MWIFSRKEPPPPPPKPKIPGWVSITVPIVFAVVLGLLTLVYNGIAGELKELKDDKADKEITYKQIEQNQKILEKHQEQLDSTLKVIIEMQTEQKAMKYQTAPPPPTGFKMLEQPAEVNKPVLTPQQFEAYMKMSKENRAAFRKLHPSYATLPE